MVDEIFGHPRLVAIYDALAPTAVILRCTPTSLTSWPPALCWTWAAAPARFALLLADRGHEVTGVDPALGSLAVAKAKPGAERVRWIHGDATAVPALRVDLATMTGNVAQAIVDQRDWEETLVRLHRALRPGGHLVFETRDPACRAWERWNRSASYTVTEIPGVGEVSTWVELTDVNGPLVSFRHTWVFASDGQVLTSDSTLRFRERAEVEATLLAQGYELDEVRDAPDRPAGSLCSSLDVQITRNTSGPGLTRSPTAATSRPFVQSGTRGGRSPVGGRQVLSISR